MLELVCFLAGMLLGVAIMGIAMTWRDGTPPELQPPPQRLAGGYQPCRAKVNPAPPPHGSKPAAPPSPPPSCLMAEGSDVRNPIPPRPRNKPIGL